MIRYPGGVGKKLTTKPTKKITTLQLNAYKNRGMSFEHEINQSNLFYLESKRAVITKRPTPINVVKVDYTKGAKITHAYFETQSTTDYNGIYRGKYLDFEAKSTQSKTALPIANITGHQRTHLTHIIEQGGIAFFIISFTRMDEVYVLKAEDFLAFCLKEKRKSIPISWIKKFGTPVPIKFQPRLDYLSAIDALFF